MQRYFSKKLIDNKFLLNSDDLFHITKVMRMNTNDKIEVVYEEEVYLCSIELLNKEVFVNKLEKLDNSVVLEKEIILVVPLLKEQKMDLILQKSTELGVSKIIPVITERSIIKIEKDKFNKKKERWERIVKEASEQSFRTKIPIIEDLVNLNDLKETTGLKIVCSTIEKNNNIKNILKKQTNYDKIIVVIGPEGGLSIKEEHFLNSIGFISTTLGNRIMRVETVPLFILSVLNYEYME